jgi:hypothetical protein
MTAAGRLGNYSVPILDVCAPYVTPRHRGGRDDIDIHLIQEELAKVPDAGLMTCCAFEDLHSWARPCTAAWKSSAPINLRPTGLRH